MSKSRKLWSSIAVYTLVVLLILGAVSLVAYLTNGFSEGFRTYYVSYGKTKIMYNSELELPWDEELRFDVKPVFGIGEDNVPDYTVDIRSNAGDFASFVYFIDGERTWLDSEYDFNEVFNLVKHDTYFTIFIDKSFLDILICVYPDRDITMSNSSYSDDYFFVINIGFGDSKGSISIAFKSDFDSIARSIELDKGGIVF